MGGKIQGNSAVARYALSNLRELPRGDIEVVVIIQAGTSLQDRREGSDEVGDRAVWKLTIASGRLPTNQPESLRDPRHPARQRRRPQNGVSRWGRQFPYHPTE